MNRELNISRLNELLINLQEITTLKISLHDLKANELYTVNKRSAFCDLIINTPEGYSRCYACDLDAINSMEGRTMPYQYRCHAGLVETAIPVTESGQLLAVILLGQILDNSPVNEQWQRTYQLCGWHAQFAELENAFFKLPRLTPRTIQAAYKIINACVSEVRLEKIISYDRKTEAQHLTDYINRNYSQTLSLDEIAYDLAISKSKLCEIARNMEADGSVGKLITRKRIEVAKQKLLSSELLIQEVATLVGIPDYNYFTKVFKKQVGTTPSEFRKRNQVH